MRKVLLITYHKRALFPLGLLYFIEEIKKADKWWHYMENVWIIVTDKDARYWESKLVPLLNRECDDLLIIELKQQVGNNYGGILPENAWYWLQDNLKE